VTEASGGPSPRSDRPKRDRPPPGRIAPEALAAARGGAVEGLDWLGRPPEANASQLVRLTALVARFVLFGLFRFRVDVEGRELLPRGGGYIVVAAAHRGWMDPFVVLVALPIEPRVWFLGSGPSAFGPRWREALIHRLGGLLPVWRGGVGVDKHVTAARAVLANGAVFAQMPEGTVSGPAGRIGPFRSGAAVIALRTGAPMVLLAMAGTEELYLGRRMAARILPPTSAAELLGPDWDGLPPAQGSRQELDLARRLTDRFAERLGPAVAALYPWTIDPTDHPRRLRRRLTWLLLRSSRLDRETPPAASAE
jgi:1-acyl-sn-glycerol-3-phosphate acyltransferase